MECMITLYMCREGEDVYIECIDDNPVYVKGGGVCEYGVYR